MNQETIYVVQGRSGIVFLATMKYDKAKELQNSLNSIESDRGYITHWINDKLIFKE